MEVNINHYRRLLCAEDYERVAIANATLHGAMP